MENTTHFDFVHQQRAAVGATATGGGLKRTISKCSMDDATLYENGSGAAMKKLVSGDHHTHAAHAMLFDHGEPVLLPRGERSRAGTEPEESPPIFGWNDSPADMKNRYYESLLESTAMLSPSPHHMMYPTTPTDTASTMSMDSSISGLQTPAGAQQTAGGDREYLSPANLHVILLDYLGEVFTYYGRAKGFTFMQLAQSLQTAQSSFRYIQGTVKVRLGISWHLVGNFVENVLDFISDEDIREATVLEFACFLKELQESAVQRMPTDNIFGNLYEFFREVLEQFKKYLAKLWVQMKRINFPCEFGKKSDSLFLCMECHREHL
ncbi:hypothetical protein Gpo141_00012891 [Globisporangium polare]